MPGTGVRVVRYSERPELWEAISGLSDDVWPEYNQYGDALNHYWTQLYDVFPDWQFVLYDPAGNEVLAEGHTIPVAWDGSDSGLGPGIDATIAAGFRLRAEGRPADQRVRAGRRDPAAAPRPEPVAGTAGGDGGAGPHGRAERRDRSSALTCAANLYPRADASPEMFTPAAGPDDDAKSSDGWPRAGHDRGVCSAP